MLDRATSTCRCWRIVRTDGRVYGFTDHDGVLAFDGTEFRPTEAMTARAVAQTTGLSVDNSEALGALSDSGLTEDDIAAGRFDGAMVEILEVDWSAPENRSILFAGEIGEIERNGTAFRAELRGLGERLNRPLGRLYAPECSSDLGDRACGVSLEARGLIDTATVLGVDDTAVEVETSGRMADWYANGRALVTSGAADGLSARIRNDEIVAGRRRLALWSAIPGLAPGDTIELTAGCRKSAETCRSKFDNILNFRGFPSLPAEDWLTAYPNGGDGHE